MASEQPQGDCSYRERKAGRGVSLSNDKFIFGNFSVKLPHPVVARLAVLR
jgi:hypothetical protein